MKQAMPSRLCRGTTVGIWMSVFAGATCAMLVSSCSSGTAPSTLDLAETTSSSTFATSTSSEASTAVPGTGRQARNANEVAYLKELNELGADDSVLLDLADVACEFMSEPGLSRRDVQELVQSVYPETITKRDSVAIVAQARNHQLC